MECKTKATLRTRGGVKKPKRADSKENSSTVDLKARYDRLLRENARLKREIADLESRGITANLAPQMQALHDYNDMKDLTQMVLGYLADAENVTVTELHRRYHLPLE